MNALDIIFVWLSIAGFRLGEWLYHEWKWNRTAKVSEKQKYQDS